MARLTNRLNARQVASLKEPGLYADGGGLYLQVDGKAARRWTFIFQWQRKRREMGLGSAATVSLAEAREAALAARRKVAAGEDPIEVKKTEQRRHTFADVAEDVLASLAPGLSNEKHRAQWRVSLMTMAAPLCLRPIEEITTDEVLAVLRPRWNRTPETASRLRGRIERVFDAAKARGLRSGENPARWRGHLEMLLPKQMRLVRGHHAAISFEAMPQFFAVLRQRPAVAARALEFTILTAARTGEVRMARWSEIDLENAVWVVPATRMKARTEHRVPLSSAAVASLVAVQPLKPDGKDGFVFPNHRRTGPLSGMAMTMLMRRMEFGEYTVHGFRSTFRDWVGDCTDFARETAEAALAHVVGNAVERAYRRSDAFAKRRNLMNAWAAYCCKVISHPASQAAA